MTLPVDINDSPNYTSDEHADHHNDLHAEYNTPTHTHSGSSGAPFLPLDIVPGTPHAKDDEFSGSSLDVKWTDPLTSAAGQTNTIVVANGWLMLEPATAGAAGTGKNVFGIRQASPTGSFSISAKCATGRNGGGADATIAGIFVARSTATAKGHVLGMQPGFSRFVEMMGVAGYSQTADWPTWDGLEANVTGETWGPRWLKIKWDASASTIDFLISGNGVDYHRYYQRTAMAQPEVIGICLYNKDGAVPADARIWAEWFRVTEP